MDPIFYLYTVPTTALSIYWYYRQANEVYENLERAKRAYQVTRYIYSYIAKDSSQKTLGRRRAYSDGDIGTGEPLSASLIDTEEWEIV